jgi:hypothetical protein
MLKNLQNGIKMVYLCCAHLTLIRKKEFRKTMHPDMHRLLRFKELPAVSYHIYLSFA